MPLEITSISQRDLALRWTFDQVVYRKIMPLAVRSRLHLEQEQNPMLQSSETFAPLHHAICAISILAIKPYDCPMSMELAFRHYDRAISTASSWSPPSYQEPMFYLHFLLLLFDIACASRRWLKEQAAWFLHLYKLVGLAHVPGGSSTSCLKAYLSWHVLTLDSYAVLAGNKDSGHYVCAFLDGHLCLPSCAGKEGHDQCSYTSNALTEVSHCDKLYMLMCTSLAEQSQLSLRLRAMHLADPSQHQLTRNQIEKLVLRQEHQLKVDYPWLEDSGDAVADLQDEKCNSGMDIRYSRTQYWVLLIQLYTCFRPRQVMRKEQSEDTDVEYCSRLLSLVRGSLEAGEEQDHLHVYALFLAGILASSPGARAEVFALLSQMRGVGLPGSVDRVMSFLSSMFGQRSVRWDSKQVGAKVLEWTDIMGEIDMMFIVVGL